MVLIGIDPHKGSHTAVAIDGHENQPETPAPALLDMLSESADSERKSKP